MQLDLVLLFFFVGPKENRVQEIFSVTSIPYSLNRTSDKAHSPFAASSLLVLNIRVIMCMAVQTESPTRMHYSVNGLCVS